MDSNSPVSRRKDSLQRELDELFAVKFMIEGELFQKYFATPLYQEKKQLKDAYDCESLKELQAMKGKKWGLDRFFNISKEVDTKIRFLRSEIEKL